MSFFSKLFARPDDDLGAPFDMDVGLALLNKKQFDRCDSYFKRHLEGNAQAHYGLALSRFRRDVESLSAADAEGIARLFGNAILLDPTFADAHFMGAMAYNFAAGLRVGDLKSGRVSLDATQLDAIESLLATADQNFSVAIDLEPRFAPTAAGELKLTASLRAACTQLRAHLSPSAPS